jgi:hypothetical protein
MLLAAATMMLPIGMLANPASAAVTQPGKCAKLTTKTVGKTTTATVSTCTPLAATGGKGVGTFNSTGAPSGTVNINIKWANGKGTTKTNIKFVTQASKGKCAAGTTSRLKITGKVTGGSGAALKTFKVNQPVNGSVCVSAKGYVLEPGTALKF